MSGKGEMKFIFPFLSFPSFLVTVCRGAKNINGVATDLYLSQKRKKEISKKSEVGYARGMC
jgi:hypothetical protein